jgi:excisionase family DNA binding protein
VPSVKPNTVYGPPTVGAVLLLLNRRQLAESLGVTERTIAGWDLAGKIPAIRIGRTVRYNAADVLEWLRRTGGPAR